MNRRLMSGKAASLGALAALALAVSCDENLPSGPVNFAAGVRIVVPRDTIVVGDTSQASAEVVDGNGGKIQNLSFIWSTTDANVLSIADPVGTAAGDTSGRAKIFIGRRPGRSNVTLTLPDPRFVTAGASRTETVVVGGVRVLSTKDTTLTAVNDTGFAIAAGLVRQNGQLVTRVSQGVRWLQRGTRTSVVGSGDTIRYIARSNGVDTLIATHDFCLAGARCADTVLVRVAQVLTIGLSSRNFQAFSFSDTLGPSVVLADRRGNGLAGTSIRFHPVTGFDSSIVAVIGPFGQSNPVNGQMAAPRLVTRGNGQARIAVVGIAPDGFTVVASDTITVVVRQVARRAAVEPLRALMTVSDSIPIRGVARDARGAVIADAAVEIVSTDVILNGVWVGPVASGSTTATLVPNVTGASLPANNPQAPQVQVIVDPSVFTFAEIDTVVAGTTTRTYTFTVLDSLGLPAFGRWVRFGTTGSSSVPDSVQVDVFGAATVTWTPPNIAGRYTLTGLRGTIAPMFFLSDSLGRIVLRRSTFVKHDIPDATQTVVSISATSIPATTGTATVTVQVRDRFGNPVRDASGTSFVAAVGGAGGTLSGFTCGEGTCQATFTAPAAAGTSTISIQINAIEVIGSPLTVTITP
jgi:hypothetical protein